MEFAGRRIQITTPDKQRPHLLNKTKQLKGSFLASLRPPVCFISFILRIQKPSFQDARNDVYAFLLSLGTINLFSHAIIFNYLYPFTSYYSETIQDATRIPVTSSNNIDTYRYECIASLKSLSAYYIQQNNTSMELLYENYPQYFLDRT